MRKSTDRMLPLEKQELLNSHDHQPNYLRRRPIRLRERLIRHIIPATLLLVAACLLFRRVFVCQHHYDPSKDLKIPLDHDGSVVLSNNKNNTKVALEAHIMSKCPDAQECLQMLVVPAMVQASDKVDFRLSYIGSIDRKDDDVHCMHGPAECLGNIIQLCAQKVYPKPKQFLGFANCMITDYQDIPDRALVESCALEYGLEFSKLNDCISQEGDGTDLLRASVKRSSDSRVTKSCTVRLEDKVWCIRDGGEWTDCPNGSQVSDLVQEIKTLAQKKELSQRWMDQRCRQQSMSYLSNHVMETDCGSGDRIHHLPFWMAAVVQHSSSSTTLVSAEYA